MRKRKLVVSMALLLFCFGLGTSNSYAETKKREGCFGRISMAPCSAPTTHGFIGPFRKPNQPHSIGKRSEARAGLQLSGTIVSQSFRKVTGGVGEWSGIVNGSGNIHLALQILENGTVTSTRYIGNVTLNNHSTSFHYQSSIPNSPNWNWKIITFVKAA